jgi:hypothetical protein
MTAAPTSSPSAAVRIWGRAPAAAGVMPPTGDVVVDVVRDTLGRGHYERMRAGFGLALPLPAWDQLPEASREVYRRRTDYLTDAVVGLLGTPTPTQERTP